MAEHLDLSDQQLAELRRTGGPLIVRLPDGEEVVIQDAAAYRRMIDVLEEIDLAESAKVCRDRLRAMQDGTDPGLSPERSSTTSIADSARPDEPVVRNTLPPRVAPRTRPTMTTPGPHPPTETGPARTPGSAPCAAPGTGTRRGRTGPAAAATPGARTRSAAG